MFDLFNLFKRNGGGGGPEGGGEMVVAVPAEMSEERVAGTGLPCAGSEDASHLLKVPARAAQPPAIDDDEERDYRPDDQIDWVIDVRFEGEPAFEQSELTAVFDRAWREAHGEPEIYGYSPDTGFWTYVLAGGGPPTFTRLAVSWRLWDRLGGEAQEMPAARLEAYERALAERVRALGQATLEKNRTSAEAEQVAARLKRLVGRCGRETDIVLAAPRGAGFAGRDVWDVMTCLGLEWGNMDLFHWEDPVGEPSLFMVWTSTPPGYFLPEEIAAGRVRVKDLAFGYVTARSPDPAAVFDSMLAAARYAQRRLGGELLDARGRPLDEEAARREIDDIVDGLREAGFSPGEGSTLRVF